MTINELINSYKSSYAFHKQTGMAPHSYLNWIKWGYIPIVSQHKLEELSGGMLKADFKHARKQ
jgi:hypothetical protein